MQFFLLGFCACPAETTEGLKDYNSLQSHADLSLRASERYFYRMNQFFKQVSAALHCPFSPPATQGPLQCESSSLCRLCTGEQ
jgi:hypothetical protein